MIPALIVYVTLVIPALLGTLKVAHGVLDLHERVRALRREGSEVV
jgi:hypothetical protein